MGSKQSMLLKEYLLVVYTERVITCELGVELIRGRVIYMGFLVSDNIAFNRLYALVGQGALNQTMWSLGLQSTRIFHRLSVELSIEQNKICGPIELDLNGIPVTLPPKKSKLAIPDTAALHGVHVGNAYIAQNGKLIEEPMDFSKKNCMSLLDLQNLLVKLFQNDIEVRFDSVLDSSIQCLIFASLQLAALFYKSVITGRKPIEIDEDFKTMLKEAMCQYPKDSCNPNYLESEYPDDYSKASYSPLRFPLDAHATTQLKTLVKSMKVFMEWLTVHVDGLNNLQHKYTVFFQHMLFLQEIVD
eukprot:Gb_40175 [translate_table: standard]